MGVCVSLTLPSPPPTVPQQDPEYMEQPSPTNDSKHLQEDTERAISRAAAEQEERNPEGLLNAVRRAFQPDASLILTSKLPASSLEISYQTSVCSFHFISLPLK